MSSWTEWRISNIFTLPQRRNFITEFHWKPLCINGNEANEILIQSRIGALCLLPNNFIISFISVISLQFRLHIQNSSVYLPTILVLVSSHLEVMSEKGIRWKSWADTAAVSSECVLDNSKSHCSYGEWEGIEDGASQKTCQLHMFKSFRVIKLRTHCIHEKVFWYFPRKKM